jgi:hypothetical protein
MLVEKARSLAFFHYYVRALKSGKGVRSYGSGDRWTSEASKTLSATGMKKTK